MGKPKPKQQQQHRESDAVVVFRISERHRTIRFCSFLAAVVIAVAIIAYAAVLIADRPWWEALIGTVIGSITTIVAGQYGFFRYLSKRWKQYTTLNQDRVAAMERQRDPQRLSSNMMKDGTNPPEDLL